MLTHHFRHFYVCYVVDSFQRTGPSESNSSKTNGDIDKPITLQEFHDKRQRIMEVPLQSSIKANSGSSTSLNNSGQSPLDFPRSNTLSTDIPRRLLTVDEPDHTPSSSGGTPKKGSIRLTRGHKRGKSWGGSKGLDSDLGWLAVCITSLPYNADLNYVVILKWNLCNKLFQYFKRR